MTAIATRLIEEARLITKGHTLWRSGKFDRWENAHSNGYWRQYFRAAMLMASNDVLGRAELVWVTADMVDLAVQAAATIPDYTWTSDILPWPSALMVFEKPFCSYRANPGSAVETIELRSLQWFLNHEHAAGLSALDPEERDVCMVVARHYAPPFHAAPVPCLTLHLENGQQMSRIEADSELRVHTDLDHQFDSARRILCSIWLLLNQRVAVRRSVSADRAARRRWERTGDRPMPRFTLVELRKPIHSGGGDANSEQVNWTHRWMVDGHWRMQWHPSTRTNVPTWIAPHVKGPDDKPLVLTRRVNAWVR